MTLVFKIVVVGILSGIFLAFVVISAQLGEGDSPLEIFSKKAKSAIALSCQNGPFFRVLAHSAVVLT